MGVHSLCGRSKVFFQPLQQPFDKMLRECLAVKVLIIELLNASLRGNAKTLKIASNAFSPNNRNGNETINQK